MVSNMYDEILAIEELEKLDTHEQRNRLAYWRIHFQQKEIMKGLQVGSKKYYDLVKDLDLPKAPRGRNSTPGRKAKAKVKKEPEQKAEPIQPPAPIVEEEKKQPAAEQIIVNGLHLVYSGTYKATQIQKQLEKLSLLVDEEEDEFFVEFRILQKQPK